MLANAGGLRLERQRGEWLLRLTWARRKENRRSLAALGMTKREGCCRERAGCWMKGCLSKESVFVKGVGRLRKERCLSKDRAFVKERCLSKGTAFVKGNLIWAGRLSANNRPFLWQPLSLFTTTLSFLSSRGSEGSAVLPSLTVRSDLTTMDFVYDERDFLGAGPGLDFFFSCDRVAARTGNAQTKHQALAPVLRS